MTVWVASPRVASTVRIFVWVRKERTAFGSIFRIVRRKYKVRRPNPQICCASHKIRLFGLSNRSAMAISFASQFGLT